MDRLDCNRMFVAVLDTGSFAAAAARLGTSGGQASKMVSRLETDLGIQLIKRTTRALSPTEAGQAYYLRLKDLLGEFDALEAAVRSTSGTPSGRLRVTAPVTFGTSQLVPVLLDFARAWPGIELDVSFSDRQVSLVDEGFDLAVRIGHVPDSSLIARRLCEARVVLVAAPAYLAQRGTPQLPADLVGHDCIIDTNFRDPLSWDLGGQAVHIPGARLRFTNAEACLAAAMAGMGVARIPSFIAGPRIRTGDLQLVMPAHQPPGHPLHALYPPARHLALKVRALIGFLADTYRGQPPWDQGW